LKSDRDGERSGFRVRVIAEAWDSVYVRINAHQEIPVIAVHFREIEARTNIPQFFFRHGVQILQQKPMVET